MRSISDNIPLAARARRSPKGHATFTRRARQSPYVMGIYRKKIPGGESKFSNEGNND